MCKLYFKKISFLGSPFLSSIPEYTSTKTIFFFWSIISLICLFVCTFCGINDCLAILGLMETYTMGMPGNFEWIKLKRESTLLATSAGVGGGLAVKSFSPT